MNRSHGLLFWLVAACAPNAASEQKRVVGSVEQVWEFINAEKESGGRCAEELFPPSKPFIRDSKLEQAARVQARRCAKSGRIAHHWPDNSTPQTRANAQGFQGDVSETLMSGPAYPDAVARKWFESEPHCRILRDPRYDRAGMAVETVEGGLIRFYWVAVVGQSVSGSP